MKCSVSFGLNNEADLDRYVAVVDGGDDSKRVANGVESGCSQVWDDHLRIGDQLEDLGFDGIFAYEHHFTPYIQIPNPLQWLAFWAGRTKKLGVGTMVTVLPWHNPMRVVEDLVNLQYMLGDRDMTIGIGRGTGVREFSGLNINMEDSRALFTETIEVIQLALTEEAFEYKGECFQFPDPQREGRVSIRPRPLDPQRLLDSLYGVWFGIESCHQIARAGIKPLVIPNRGYENFEAELREFAAIRRDLGMPPTPATVTSAFTYCAESQKDKDDMRELIARVKCRSADVTYEYSKNYHAHVKGYEHVGETVWAKDSDPLLQIPIMHLWTLTPDEMIKYIQEIYDMYDSVIVDHYVMTFTRLNIPVERCEKSMRLFAKEVLPFLKELQPRKEVNIT